jgi:hypothetical protein
MKVRRSVAKTCFKLIKADSHQQKINITAGITETGAACCPQKIKINK